MNRICILLNNAYAPDNRVRRELDSLRNAGYQVDLFAVGSNDYPAFETFPGLNIYRVLKKLPKYAPFTRLTLSAFWEIISKYGKYNFVHAHDANMLPLGFMLSKFWGARLVYDSHEFWASLFEEQHKKLLNKSTAKNTEIRRLEHFQKFECWALSRCDAVISVNQSICGLLQERATARIPHCIPIRNIPPFFEIPFQTQGTLNGRPRLFHQEFQLSPETSIVLYQGGIVRKRGISILLDVAEQLDNVAFMIMGPTDDAYLKEIFTQVSLSPRLRQSFFFKAAVPPDELLCWTSSADLGIHPILNTERNHYYCLPNKIFEYIQAGLPVAASNFPEIQNIVSSYDVGFTFDPENSSEIAGKISQYFLNQSRQKEIAQNLSRAKQELCWEREAEKLMMLYQELGGIPDAKISRKLIDPQKSGLSETLVSSRQGSLF